MRKVAFLIAASPTDAFYSQIAALVRAPARLSPGRNWRAVHARVRRRRSAGRPACATGSRTSRTWTSPGPRTRDSHETATGRSQTTCSGSRHVTPTCWWLSTPTRSRSPASNRCWIACTRPAAVAGVIAHYPTVLDFEFDRIEHSSIRPARTPRVPARRVGPPRHDGLTDAPLDFAYAHTLMGAEHPPEHRLTPFYLNFGVVAFPRAAFDLVAPRYLTMQPAGDGTNARCRLLRTGRADARHRRRAGSARGPSRCGTTSPTIPSPRRMYPGELEQGRDRSLPANDRVRSASPLRHAGRVRGVSRVAAVRRRTACFVRPSSRRSEHAIPSRETARPARQT